jgi:hypothetical protein
MEHEFGTGLRAHLERRVEPQDPPTERDEDEPQPPRGDLDARMQALAAAEAELTWRERRVADRELAFHVAVQRTVYRIAQEMLDGEIPPLPQDELASLRQRRRGFAA